MISLFLGRSLLTMRHETINIGVGSGLGWNSVGRDCPLPPLVVSVKSEIIIGIDKICAPRIGDGGRFR